jgi:2-dehydropantoate 2-reductase
MRHAILGAGGVGGLIGACLARVGETVTLVVRAETLDAHPAKLQLNSAFGNWSVEVGWASSVPPTDVLWLAVKATQLEGALRSIADDGSLGAIVPLLNGIDHLELLRSKYGRDRVIPATIAGETERVSMGCIIHRSPFARLNVLSRGRGLLQRTINQLQGLGFTCDFVDDEATLMWSKLVFLAPLALTTSAWDRTVGDIVAEPETWRQLQACVREACAAGQAEGRQGGSGRCPQRDQEPAAGHPQLDAERPYTGTGAGVGGNWRTHRARGTAARGESFGHRRTDDAN